MIILLMKWGFPGNSRCFLDRKRRNLLLSEENVWILQRLESSRRLIMMEIFFFPILFLPLYLSGGNINHINSESLCVLRGGRKKKRDAESFIADRDGERRWSLLILMHYRWRIEISDVLLRMAWIILHMLHLQTCTKLCKEK